MTRKAFSDGNGFLRILDEPVPANECTHRTHDAVTDFFAVNNDFDVVREQVLQLVEQTTCPIVDVVGVVGTVLVGHAQFVVIVEIVGRRDDADQAAEMVLPDPDDLLLSTDAAMIVPVAARSFTHRQPIFEDPCEVPGCDPQSPFSS